MADQSGNDTTYNDFVVGYKGSFTRKVTQRDNDLFAELSGDHNPLHFSDEVAKGVGFKGKVCNGFVTESRLAAALVETFTSPNTIVLELEKNTRFRKSVYMDDEITATVEVVGRVESMRALKIKAQCVNQNQETVIDCSMVVQILPK